VGLLSKEWDNAVMPLELAVGHSQIAPYINGHALAESRGLTDCAVHGLVLRGERYEPYVQFTAEGPKLNPTAIGDIRAAVEAQHPTGIVVALLGAHHWVYGVCNEPRAFDFVVPELPQHKVTAGMELIPYGLMLRRIRSDLDWQFGLVREVKTFCKIPTFHIEAPPPVQSAELMLQGVYGAFRDRMTQFGFPSASFRYKMWWLWVQVAKQLCAELGDHFIEGPPETRDANGFLDERYYLDGIHGNDEYGALMVREVAVARRRVGMSDG
jgi:hypothetical protein